MLKEADFTWIENSILNRGIIVSTARSVKSMLLKGEDDMTPEDLKAYRAKIQEQQHRVEGWSRILKLFNNGVLIMDELNWIIQPLKSELNFPIGDKSKLGSVSCVEFLPAGFFPRHLIYNPFFLTFYPPLSLTPSQAAPHIRRHLLQPHDSTPTPEIRRKQPRV